MPESVRKNFYTGAFWSIFGSDRKGGEIMKDRNIYTGERYKDIFENRKIKCQFLLDDMPKKVKNYKLIKYEDLCENYNKVIDDISVIFDLERKKKKKKLF